MEWKHEKTCLALGNLVHQNISLLFKWVWRDFSEPGSLWRKVIQCKYKYPPNFRIVDLQIPPSGVPWRDICPSILNNHDAKRIVVHRIRCKVGNGENSLFWHDNWIGESPLKILYPRLFSISPNQNATISSMGFWNGCSWTWTLAWKRSPRIRDTVECDSMQALLDHACLSLENNDQLI